jgi:hypothetical protein
MPETGTPDEKQTARERISSLMTSRRSLLAKSGLVVAGATSAATVFDSLPARAQGTPRATPCAAPAPLSVPR